MRNKSHHFLNYFRIVCIIAALVFFASGCADDGKEGSTGRDGNDCDCTPDTSRIKQGVFLDSAVEGLEYECGDQFGITDKYGGFWYEPGKTVTFRIGDILLGHALANPEMTPLDLVTGADTYKNPTVTNMVRFLQTLDDDLDPNNGIQIPEGAGYGENIDFNSAPEDFEAEAESLMDELFSDQRDLVPTDEAHRHFRFTLLFVPGSEIDLKLEKVMKDAVKDNDDALGDDDFPGAIMAILTPSGEEWVRTIGVSNLETRDKLDRYSMIRIGSVTKTFTGMAIAQLAQEGKLGMDDTLEEWLPGMVPFPSPEEEASGDYTGYNSKKITIRHMLQHISGLFNFVGDEDMLWNINYYTDRQMTPTELVEAAMKEDYEPVSYPEDPDWHYSNTNYVLLGMIIEKASGNTYEEEVHMRFIEPLGLDFTSVPKTGDLGFPGEYAHGYFDLYHASTGEIGADGVLVDNTYIDPSLTWSSGNMISTPADLAKWVKAIAEGELFDEANQEAVLNDMFPLTRSSLSYGYGITRDSGKNLLGHRGQIPGYDTAMFYNFDLETSIAVTVNQKIKLEVGDAQILILNDVMDILLGVD